MSSQLPIPPPGFDELSSDEQVEYVQALWDRITSEPANVSVPDWHMQIVEERLADYAANGMEGITLEEFEKKIFEQLTKD